MKSLERPAFLSGRCGGITLGVTPTHQRKRDLCRGEITATGAAYKAWIIVKGEHAGQAMLAKKLGHHLKESFGIEIAAHLAV